MGFALFSDAPPSVEALRAALADEIDGTVTLTQAEGVGAVLVEAPGGRVLVTPLDEPIPAESLRPSCHPLWWRNSAEVDRHRSCVAVCVEYDPGEDAPAAALQAATLASACAALVLELEGALAFFSGTAGLTLPAEIYRQIVEEDFEAGLPPVDVWTASWLTTDADRRIGGHTMGLAALGHADLMVEPRAVMASDVYHLLSGLSQYILTSGTQLLPGHDVAVSETERLVVRAVESELHEGQVLRLETVAG